MDTCRKLFGQRWAVYIAVMTLFFVLVGLRFYHSPSPDRELPPPRSAQAMGRDGEGKATVPLTHSPAKQQSVLPEPTPGVQGDAAQGECPPEEYAALSKAVPLYVHWHWMRHAQWHEDEVIDTVLEALAKEEEGEEGTTKGRGPTFRLMRAVLEAAGPAKAELVTFILCLRGLHLVVVLSFITARMLLEIAETRQQGFRIASNTMG